MMGSWGTAVYANDTSSDVRDMCNEVYPLVEKVSCPSERDRFFDLLHQKWYATDPVFHFELYDAFGDFFEEKARLTGAGIPYDNLLDRDVSNPPLLSPKEIQKRIQQEIETEMKAAKDDR